MSFWKRNMRQTISVQTYTAVNQYGESVLSAAVTYPARVELSSDTISLEDGVEVLITHRIATTAPLKRGDLVTLPGESGTRIVQSAKSASRLTTDERYTIAEVA